ncbi:hypothetical protein [Peterkaempfera sp. SMS 1(5)a]|uniref:hypothetical protein n=1 Tax=Peterkaempfera podocarpi TaxID=3232308 RepID=UPI00366F1ED8
MLGSVAGALDGAARILGGRFHGYVSRSRPGAFERAGGLEHGDPDRQESRSARRHVEPG